jgi:hypothetical protein
MVVTATKIIFTVVSTLCVTNRCTGIYKFGNKYLPSAYLGHIFRGDASYRPENTVSFAFEWEFFLVILDIICTQRDGAHENELFRSSLLLCDAPLHTTGCLWRDTLVSELHWIFWHWTSKFLTHCCIHTKRKSTQYILIPSLAITASWKHWGMAPLVLILCIRGVSPDSLSGHPTFMQPALRTD